MNSTIITVNEDKIQEKVDEKIRGSVEETLEIPGTRTKFRVNR